MTDPYGLPEDLRRLISSRTTTLLPQPPDPLSLHHHNTLNPPPPPHYDPINFINTSDSLFFPPSRTPNSNNNPFTHYYNNSPSNSLNPTTSCIPTASDHAFGNTNNLDTTNAAEKAWLGGFDSGTNRWPRQETLSLLEIRSRLDSKFRENNQKAPLWNEISRIMAEEFGYQRSGKKCKEKFENLYKYYKKTKEGKASRQDGKHYRFFRQLEAICGGTSSGAEPSNTPPLSHHLPTPTSFKINHQQDHINFVDHHHHHHLKSSESHLSFSNSSELETSSSENNNNNNNNDEDLSAIAYMLNNNQNNKQNSSSSRDNNKQKGLLLELGDDNTNHDHDHHVRPTNSRRRSWRAKVEEIVGSHMRKIIETQDAWMERMLSVVEQREQEMASKEEERKKKESIKFDQQVHELWAKERAWVEARDAALIEVVRKHIGHNNNNNKDIIEAAMVFGSHNNNKSKIGSGENNNEEYHNSSSGGGGGGWSEMEISNLIQLRSGFEQRLMRENSNSNSNSGNMLLENGVWEEIAGKLGCMGYERSAGECKQIWDEISISLGRTNDCAAKTTRPWCLGLKLTDNHHHL